MKLAGPPQGGCIIKVPKAHLQNFGEVGVSPNVVSLPTLEQIRYQVQKGRHHWLDIYRVGGESQTTSD